MGVKQAWSALWNGQPATSDDRRLSRMVRGVARAAYQAASNHRVHQGHFGAATDSVNAALAESLETLRRRNRQELRNNAHAVGLQRTLGDLLVGRGPTPNIECEDHEDWAETVERNFSRWARRCGYLEGETFAELLRLGVMEWMPCGEFLWIPRSDDSDPAVASLRYLPVRSDRLQTPYGQAGNNRFDRGIELDADGRAVAYWLLKDDPENLDPVRWGYGEDAYERVPAAGVIHGYRRRETGQRRGEPLMAQMLHVFASVRRHNEATLLAAEMAAMIAVFLEANFPESSKVMEDPTVLTPETFALEPGSVTVGMPGYKATQIRPEHPGQSYHEFRRDNFGEAGRAAQAPVSVVTGDSSEHSWATARRDDQLMDRCYDVAHADLDRQVGERVFAAWLREDIVAGRTPPPPAPYTLTWLWDRPSHSVNPSQDAAAREKDLANHVETLEDIWTRRGLDPRKQYEKLRRQRQALAGLADPAEAAPEETDPEEDAA